MHSGCSASFARALARVAQDDDVTTLLNDIKHFADGSERVLGMVERVCAVDDIEKVACEALRGRLHGAVASAHTRLQSDTRQYLVVEHRWRAAPLALARTGSRGLRAGLRPHQGLFDCQPG